MALSWLQQATAEVPGVCKLLQTLHLQLKLHCHAPHSPHVFQSALPLDHSGRWGLSDSKVLVHVSSYPPAAWSWQTECCQGERIWCRSESRPVPVLGHWPEAPPWCLLLTMAISFWKELQHRQPRSEEERAETSVWLLLSHGRYRRGWNPPWRANLDPLPVPPIACFFLLSCSLTSSSGLTPPSSPFIQGSRVPEMPCINVSEPICTSDDALIQQLQQYVGLLNFKYFVYMYQYKVMCDTDVRLFLLKWYP